MPRIEQATEGKAAALPLARIISHRRLVSTIFPWPMGEEMTRSAVAVPDHEMIHCAASQGMRLLVRALLEGNIFTCDVRDRFGRTPLHWASEQGHCKIALELLKAGAWVDPCSQRKFTPIMLAAYHGHAEVVGLLLKFRAGESDRTPLNRLPIGVDNWRRTALHCAAAGGHVQLVEVLLDSGFDRGQKDGAGLTPAEVSARKTHSTSTATTRLLLPTSDGGGKLVYDYVNMAVQDVAMVTGLVKGGANLEWRDGTGDTPLHRAALFGHVVTSRILLQGGANPNICDNYGESPLHVAASQGCGEIVAALLESGSHIEQLTVDGQSPLHRAVVKNNLHVVELLLTAGASTEHLDENHGQTPLSWACRGCLAPIVRVLAKAGADTESRCSVGLTPLHWACRFNDAESVEALLNAGADPSAVDQAAAYAIATLSSPSSRNAPEPSAVDVIGLGYPLDRVEDWRHPFTGGSLPLAARRLDLATVRRIESALKNAKREKSWRRRGWLVVFAKRRIAEAENMEVLGEQQAVRCGVCSCPNISSSSTPPTLHAFDLVKHPPCSFPPEAAADRVAANKNNVKFDSRHSRRELSCGSSILTRRPAAEAMAFARAAGSWENTLSGNVGTQDDVEALFPELVDALLELAAIEVGIFHRVVMFI